jgi:membrane glycosyltransferase
VTCMEALTGHKYFPAGAHSLFPSWPQYRDGEIAALLGMTAVVLFVPKMLGGYLTMRDPALRAAFGGTRKFILSSLIEQGLSILMAPIMMLFHSEFVLRALLGRSVGWEAQPRGDRGISWHESMLRHRWHVAIGLIWGCTILFLAPDFIWWMLPVVVGLLIAVPFTTLTSRSELGVALRNRGLLLTPEETAPPPELVAAEAARARRAQPPVPLIEQQPSLAEIPDGVGISVKPNLTVTMVPPRAPLPMSASAPAYLQVWKLPRRRISAAP